MRNTFKPTQNNQKQHNRNVIHVLSYALAHADRGTLFKQTGHLRELLDEGVVYNDIPGKFSLPVNVNGNKLPQKTSGWKARTRVTKVQSPGEGAYAFVIKTGRDFEVTTYCNKMKEEGGEYYFCEAFWKQGTENLGNIQYRIDARLVTLE